MFIDARYFFACGRSAPVRVKREDDAAAWLVGTLVGPSVQGHRLPLLQELWPFQSLFFQPHSWRSEGLFGHSFSITPPAQALRWLRSPPLFFSVSGALRGPPGWGPTFCRSACQALKGAPWVGSYSVVQCIRPLMGQPPYCSAAYAGVWGGERLW